jgi:hypothetical protein
MADPGDENAARCVVDLIKDAVIADAIPVLLLGR